MGSVASSVTSAVSDVFEDVGEVVGDAVETVSEVVSDVFQGVGDVVEDTAQAISQAGVELDEVVNREIPGGWITVGGVAATVATAGALGAFSATQGAATGAASAAQGVAAAESAVAFAGGSAAAAEAAAVGATAAANSGWALAGDAITKVAMSAGTNALKGAGMGAATSLIAGKDPIKGAIQGATIGGLTGGVGELANIADIGAAGTKLAQTAATSVATGKDPTKNLMNTAMSLGANALGSELGLNPQMSQAALGAGKALGDGKDPTKALTNAALSIGAGQLGKEFDIDKDITKALAGAGGALIAGKDPTKGLLDAAIGAGVGEVTKSFSDFFKEAIDDGLTPEEAYTVASKTEGADASGASAADTGGITSLSTDENGNKVYSYNDGSTLTVSPDNEVIDATEATNYVDTETVSPEYTEPTQNDVATAEYKDPGVLPTQGGGGLSGMLSNAVEKGTDSVESYLNDKLTGAISDAILPGAAPVKKPVARKPVVSQAQTARPTIKPTYQTPVKPPVQTPVGVPVSNLPATQAAATQILSGEAPAQAKPNTMTSAERMASIAKAFGAAAPVMFDTESSNSQKTSQTSPYVFASGGTVDYSKEFVDQAVTTKYMKPGITRGNANYNMPGYPFGQQWRIGMAEGGGVGGHNPQFFSEGGLNSLGNTYVKGEGDGTSDSIPAMLANGEFVIPADVVSGLGNGSNDSGAKVLDEFLKTIRKHKQKSGANGLPPDSKGPLGYLLAANKKVKK